jgi:4-hydroxybutyryl-CoA dehydratase/vinylacetyl-CoA-Delta-isomerase
MTMMTGRKYIESLRELRPDVYFMGERIINVVDEPMIHSTLRS